MQNKYIFILTLTVVCSLLLSLVSEGLREKTELNIDLDIKKNILTVIGKQIDILNDDEIINVYANNISPILIDLEGNYIKDNITHDLLEKIENKETGEIKYYYNNKEYLPFYLAEKEKSIIIPISGKGLWSTLFGYFALDTDNYSTVKGITFYQHGETAGLGGEIVKDWFKDSFKNKEIYSLDNILYSIEVRKAGTANKDKLHEVDGISGATITSKGVTELLKRDLIRYEPYFLKAMNEK